MNIASHTTRGHSPTTWTFTQLQITHRLHFPSFTAPTQLFTIITLAPVHHHPITHTLHKPWTVSHTLPSIVSLSALQSVSQYPELDFLCSQYPELDFLCSDSCPCSWFILSALPSGYCSPIVDPRLPKDYSLPCLCHTCLLLSDPACIDHVL